MVNLDLGVGGFGVFKGRMVVRMCVCRGDGGGEDDGGRLRRYVGAVKVLGSDGERNT